MKRSLMIILILLLVASSYAQPGWNWQNPLPQGNPLYGISFVSRCGWAVGPKGTAVHTNDYGETWQRIDLGTTANLNAVCMHDDLMTFMVGDSGLILFVTEDSGAYEIKQQQSPVRVNLNSVTSDINGCPWIAGNEGTILRSENMGAIWKKQNVIYKKDLRTLHNIECTEAWAVGPDGFLMHTSDLGNSWKSLATPNSSYLTSIHVGTFENIRVVGQQGLILHTENKGVTWNIEHQENGYNLLDVINLGLNAAYAVGTEGKILETTDYGSNWLKVDTEPDLSWSTFYDVEDHYGFNHTWIAGHYGVILKNSGINTTFKLQTKGTFQWLSSIEFFNNSGWAAGGLFDPQGTSLGIILRSEDGGETWDEFRNLPVQLNDADFISDSLGYVVGRDGYIGRINNVTLTKLSGPIGGFLTGVSFTGFKKGWIVSRDNWGEIVHTSDGGNTWTKQTNPSRNPLHDVFFLNEDKGWAVGLDTTIIRTTDGGQIWKQVAPYSVRPSRYASVFFIDELNGWVVGSGGVIVLTEDGGITWKQVESGTYESLENVLFTDHDNGWAVGGNGIVLKSTDGGNSWVKQHSIVYPQTLSSVCFTDQLNGWIAGEGGTIVHTTNGGFVHDKGTFLRKGLGLQILDDRTARSEIEVLFPEETKSGKILTGIEVFIDTIFHSQVSDLEITLKHNGITDTLVYGIDNNGENFLWTIFKDQAVKKLSDSFAPFPGEYVPHQPLSVFNGTDPSGIWELSIYDNNKNGETGVLYSWGIKPLFEVTTGINKFKDFSNKAFVLEQNYPNPFSGKTKISWTSEISGNTQLIIWNTSGQKISTLINQHMPFGKHSIELDGMHLNPGLYFYQLKLEGYSQTRKFIVK